MAKNGTKSSAGEAYNGAFCVWKYCV